MPCNKMDEENESTDDDDDDDDDDNGDDEDDDEDMCRVRCVLVFVQISMALSVSPYSFFPSAGQFVVQLVNSSRCSCCVLALENGEGNTLRK